MIANLEMLIKTAAVVRGRDMSERRGFYRIAVAFVLSLDSCHVPLPALADGAIETRTNQTRYAIRHAQEFRATHISNMVELPDLPTYPVNIQFQRGILFPNAGGGESYTLQFSVHEAPEDVLNWYGGALKSFGWTMQGSLATRRSIGALKNGNLCQVMVLVPSQAGFRSDVLLRYKVNRVGQIPIVPEGQQPTAHQG
jgi:hypothetical protein